VPSWHHPNPQERKNPQHKKPNPGVLRTPPNNQHPPCLRNPPLTPLLTVYSHPSPPSILLLPLLLPLRGGHPLPRSTPPNPHRRVSTQSLRSGPHPPRSEVLNLPIQPLDLPYQGRIQGGQVLNSGLLARHCGLELGFCGEDDGAERTDGRGGSDRLWSGWSRSGGLLGS